MELRTGQDIRDGFQLLVGLAEIHVPRMWVERHPDRPDHQVGMVVCGGWGGYVWVERHQDRPDHQVGMVACSWWSGYVWVERHPDRPDHQVCVCGQWVVGCGWRDTWIGPTIGWVAMVSG